MPSWADSDAIPEGQGLIACSPVQTKQLCAPDPVRTLSPEEARGDCTAVKRDECVAKQAGT